VFLAPESVVQDLIFEREDEGANEENGYEHASCRGCIKVTPETFEGLQEKKKN
jgi:hypothetical protein